MEKKLLLIGKHTIEKNQWGPLRILLGMDPGDRTKITIVNKSLTDTVTPEDMKGIDLILSLQNNPLLLKRVWKLASKHGITIVKPFKNKEKVITHFMKINEVIVDYKYDLVAIGEKKQQSKKPAYKKSNDVQSKKVAYKKPVKATN